VSSYAPYFETGTKSHTRKGTTLQAITIDADVLRKFVEFLDAQEVSTNGTAPEGVKSKGKKAKKEKAVEVEPEEAEAEEVVDDSPEARAAYRQSFNGKRLTTLTKVAAEAGIKKPSTDRAELLDQLVVAKFGEPEVEEESEPDEPKSKKKGKKDKGKKAESEPKAKEKKGKKSDPDFENAKQFTKYLKALDIKDLRKLALAADFDEADVKGAKKGELIEALVEDKFEGEADEPEAEETEDGLSRDELEGLNLRELKAIAKEKGSTTADLKGLDQESVIDLILGEDGGEGEEGEEDYYTVEELKKMSVTELRAIAKEYDIKTTGLSKAQLVDALKE
jgi:hypothetical protein